MSRPQRIEFPNAYYHVMNRGAGSRKIFNNNQEYELFLNVLSEAHIQYNIEIFSYCLMSNHYHLLIKTPHGNLARAMRHINGIYTQRYNRLNVTDGPLFRGRYKSILIDSDSYLLHLSKYIHLNPLEAKMVDDLCNYKWSSYKAYIGNCDAPSWLFQSEIYGQLTTSGNKKELYQLFMENIKLNNKIINFFDKERTPPIFGGEEFISSVNTLNQSEEIAREDKLFKRPSLEKVIEETAREFSQSKESVIHTQKGRGRKNIPKIIAMYIAKKIYDYRLKEIAEVFGLAHYGAVASAISKLTAQLSEYPELGLKLNTIIKRLAP
jgi:putative transposase